MAKEHLESLLEDVRDQLLTDVDAKRIAGDACHKDIISEEHETSIKEAKSVRAANEILFTHLLRQATQSSLEDLCQIMISVKGYRKMKEFGQELLGKVNPGSSQVSSATPSDMETEDKPKLQRATRRPHRKRPPSQDGSDPKRSKDSHLANHFLLDIDAIDRDLTQCLKIHTALLKSKHVEPEEVIPLVYSSICQCIAAALHKQLDGIKSRIVVDCKRKLGPFKHVSQMQLDAIEHSHNVFDIMTELGILDRWLNTSLLHFFISLSSPDSDGRAVANYWLQQYTVVLSGFCRQFLVRNIPREYHHQLREGDLVSEEHHRLLCVVYNHDFTTFTLADLLKEIAFLEEALQIPPDVIKFLHTVPSNSVAVYWFFDMSYAALIFFDVHQLFWALLEHHVLSLELKDVMTVSLRGSHVLYLIRNALQSGQNLIRQTEVFTRQFHALVGLGVSEHSFENADTVRRRTVCRKFVQSVTTKTSIPAQTRRVLLDQQDVSEALLKLTSEKNTPVKKIQEDKGDRRAGHPEDEQHPSVPPLEVPLPFAEDLDVPTAPTELPKQQLLLLPDPPPASKEDEWQDPAVKYAPKEQHPKKKRRRELERKKTREQLSALPIKPARPKVTAEQSPLSQEALSAALKMFVSPTLQSTVEAVKYPTMVHIPKEPTAALIPTKSLTSAVAGVPESVVHFQADVFVDHPHLGQDRNFDDKDSDTVLRKKGKDKSKWHPVMINPECFALICWPCMNQLLDKMTMRPLGTCKAKGHIKKMIVQQKGTTSVNVPVRSRRLPSGQDCKMDPCRYYPNCFNGDMCQLAHGEEELGYWKGSYKEQKELCLDCRSQTAQRILQQCQKEHKARLRFVVYSDADCREIVPVHWPIKLSRMPPYVRFTVKAEHLNTCGDPTACSFPHHYLEARILNLWRENSVVTSTRPSLTWFLAELKRAATSHKKMGPLPKEVLSERDEHLSETLTRANYLENLYLLTEWEHHTHVEALEKYNVPYTFSAITHKELMSTRQEHRDQPVEERDKKCTYYILLFMPDQAADHLRQAASWVFLKFQNGVVLEGGIEKSPKRFNSNFCLAVGIEEASSKVGVSQTQGIPVFLTHASSKRVGVSFVLKHSYFASLRNALRLLPIHMVDSLVPDKKTLENRQVRTSDKFRLADLNYPVLEFELDEEYQESTCEKVLQSSTSAPFLITGPFGAGKTRLLATIALRILLHSPRCFILIATHHVRTADQYIEKYFKPILEGQDFEKKHRLKVVRVVGRDVVHDQKSKYTKIVDSMDSETVAKYNLIITTFGTMLQLQRLLQRYKHPYFTHIFVDEGAQAREPETLGAFCHAEPGTKIVIAGDHKQVGPQTTVLGRKARDNGFTVSLVARLHKLYSQEKASEPYQAVMLTNHRSHPSILCLPNSLFYDCSLQASSKNKLHPDYKNSLHFVCTYLDDFSPDRNWHKDEVYNRQVRKEVKAAGEWVEKFIDDENWPDIEWGKKELSTLCVVVPNKHVERLWRSYARRYDEEQGIKSDAEGLGAVTCTVAYEIQGREFRAIFICTSEAVDENCATRDPVKSLCDQYVFNTVITRACSLVVAIGNPFRLMKIEEMRGRDDVAGETSSGKMKKCWQTFVFHCLQCKSLLLTKELMYERQANPAKTSEQRQSLSNLENVMFREARKGLKNLSKASESADFGDSIVQAYNDNFAEKNRKLALASNTKQGTLEWTAWKSEPEHPKHKAVACVGTPYRLWQNKRNLCTAVPIDPAYKKSYLIVGVQNRKCAFDGALVAIEVMKGESRHAKVVDVLEQGSVQPRICVVDSFDSTVFIPVDKKSPRLINLPHVPKALIKSDSSDDEFSKKFRKNQEQKAPYVICFDPLHLKHGTVPKISHIIPRDVAQHLLFVVHPMKWASNKLYPLGAVVAVLPKGSSELYSCKVLSIEHQVPDLDGDDTSEPEQYKLHGLKMPLKEDLPAAYTDVIGIVSRGGHSSLALSVEELEDCYEVGIHICNAADLVSTSDEFYKRKNHTFDRWAAMFGQCQEEIVYCSALPQSGEQDLVKALKFTCDAARRSITLKVKVSATEDVKLVEAVTSRQVLRMPDRMNLKVERIDLVESTVQCAIMLDLSSLEKTIATILQSNVEGGSMKLSEELQDDLDKSKLPIWDMLTVLYAVADKLCYDRQGHRGYPELQQTQQAFLYPEAWKVIHELTIFANTGAADQIGENLIFRQRMPLLAQCPPLEERIELIANVKFNWILKQFDLFKNLGLPHLHFHQERRLQEPQVICTQSHYKDLIRALKGVDIEAVRQLLMQPHRYPQLSVLETFIKEALPREEYVVKRISSKRKKLEKPVAELLQKAGGKHHSLQAVVAPYTAPFDSIFDVYVQFMLSRAIQDSELASTKTGQGEDQREELGHLDALQCLEVESLHEMARLCNIALANARHYESSMTSVDLAVYAQHSSICVEAFIKGMEDESIQLCYPASSLQGIVSIQTIKTKLVTKSDKASSAVYTAKVTCIGGHCVATDIHYTPAEKEGDSLAPMVVFYQEAEHLARFSIVPEYVSPTVRLSLESVQSAMKFLRNSTKEAAGELIRRLKDERRYPSADTAVEKADVPVPDEGPPRELIQAAPFYILNAPFFLQTGQVVKVWLRTDVNEYVLTPKPQLVELNQDVRICLEHNSDIQACFTQCAFAESSTLQYSSREIYFRIWEELVRAEAATNSVGGKEQFLFKDFKLKFSDFRIPKDSTSSDYYCPAGNITAQLPKDFLANRQDIFPIEQGCFACIRFDVELNGQEDQALLAVHKGRLHSGATDNHIRTVMHMVVDRVTKTEDKKEEEVTLTLEKRVINADLKVKFKVVGHHNARVSPLMKDVLKTKEPPCEMQLFPMFLPYKRVYQHLRHLERNLPKDSIGESVILGKVEQLVGRNGCSKYSGLQSDHKKLMEVLQHPNVLYHQGDGGRTLLNDEQITALMFSLMNKFQLIQGPPGTGKSITGAHIAYAFVLLNRMNAAEELATVGGTMTDSGVDGPHLKCVLYCGPSNVSVDVVLKHLHQLTKSSAKRLRILRMYGKSIETLYYEGPYYDPDLFVKKDKQDIDKELRDYALHEMVHSREEIKEQNDKFAELRRKGLIPTAEERFQYRELIRQAEKEVIRKEQYDIVLCTCNETAGYRFKSNIAPIQCIIDEAGMTTEPEAVVALSQAEQVVLIGDHMQLQPVVKNRTAGDNGLRVSLFERYANLLKREFPDPEVCPNFQQLLKQYRMVEAICDFPSLQFYDDKLETVREDVEMIPAAFWPNPPAPIAFIDIVGNEEDAEQEEDMKTSKRNEREAQTVVNVVEALDALTHPKASIAVITPYKAQKKLIEGKLEVKGKWYVQTIDASQGSEADYVVLSMVRSKPLKKIKDKTAVFADRKWRMENLGMVADSHHLCVALTRARFGLVIIGNATLLSYNGTWNELIQHYTECKYVVDEHWVKRAVDRAKPVARKQPPHPPRERERLTGQKDVQEEEIEKVVLKVSTAHQKFVKEGLQRRPQMLQEKINLKEKEKRKRRRKDLFVQ